MYLLSDHEGFYKIGKTINLDNRMRAFATEWRVKADLIHIMQTDSMTQLETELHRAFANKRQNGEWFKLSKADVWRIKHWKG